MWQALETALPDSAEVLARLVAQWGGTQAGRGVVPASVEAAAVRQEASRRRYYRLRAQTTEGAERLAVLCHDPDMPERGDQADFLVLASFLAGEGLPVPEVIALDAAAGLYIVSDAGPRDLWSALRDGDGEGLLDGAVQMAADLHSVAAPEPVSGRFFDADRLVFEIRFLEDALRDLEETRRERAFLSPELRFFLRGLCGKLGTERPLVFTHRDYHSRNLMVSSGGRLTMLDFQDARMGLPWYDVASLLFDPYAEHSADVIRHGFELYCQLTERDPGAHRNLFCAQAVQRLFKALGTYVHLTFRGGLAHIYGHSIEPALNLLELATQWGGFPDSIYLFASDARRRLLPLIPGAHVR